MHGFVLGKSFGLAVLEMYIDAITLMFCHEEFMMFEVLNS
jgi:hypothetical protein